MSKKINKQSVEWRVEPVSQDYFPELGMLGGRELLEMFVTVCGRIRDLELELSELRN